MLGRRVVVLAAGRLEPDLERLVRRNPAGPPTILQRSCARPLRAARYLNYDNRYADLLFEVASGRSGGRLEASDADVWLLRTGVEGSRRFALGGADGATLTPSFEFGLIPDIA